MISKIVVHHPGAPANAAHTHFLLRSSTSARSRKSSKRNPLVWGFLIQERPQETSYVMGKSWWIFAVLYSSTEMYLPICYNLVDSPSKTKEMPFSSFTCVLMRWSKTTSSKWSKAEEMHPCPRGNPPVLASVMITRGGRGPLLKACQSYSILHLSCSREIKMASLYHTTISNILSYPTNMRHRPLRPDPSATAHMFTSSPSPRTLPTSLINFWPRSRMVCGNKWYG